MSDYEKFQLQWMIDHGHSLRELMEELQSLQYDDPEDSDQISTPITELFERWEQDRGFGSEIWPCEAEYEGCEGKDAAGGKIILLFSDDDGVFDTALYRVRNYDGHRVAQSLGNAEMKWRHSEDEYFDFALTSLREEGYDIEEIEDYEVFDMGI